MNLQLFEEFPLLETPRLLLRELREGDVNAVFRVFSDPEVVRYYDISGLPNVDAAASLIEKLRQRYDSRGGIRWALVEKNSGNVVGTAGFNSMHTGFRRADVGYELSRQHWGHGFATEALERIKTFGHEHVGLQRIEATVMVGNDPSARVLQRCGFEEEGLLRAYGYWKGASHDLRMFSSVGPS